MNAHALEVTAYGYRNQNNDPFFDAYEFSNEVAMFKMSNGATVRICECREIGGSIANSETFRVLGTSGAFMEGKWKGNTRTESLPAKKLPVTELTVEQMRDPLPHDVAEAFGLCDLGSKAYGSHGGSHPYLVNEFVDAVAHDRQPAINIWEAARYMAMGVMAHKSALKDGEKLNVPDWGDAPE